MGHQAERQEVGKAPTPCDVARNTMDNHGTGAGIVSVAMPGHHRRHNGTEPLSEELLTSAQVTLRFPALLIYAKHPFPLSTYIVPTGPFFSVDTRSPTEASACLSNS